MLARIEPCCDKMKQYRYSLVEIDPEGYLAIQGVRIFHCPWCGEDLLALNPQNLSRKDLKE